MHVLFVDMSVVTCMTSKNIFALTLEKDHMLARSVHSKLRIAALLRNTVEAIAKTMRLHVLTVLIVAVEDLT